MDFRDIYELVDKFYDVEVVSDCGYVGYLRYVRLLDFIVVAALLSVMLYYC